MITNTCTNLIVISKCDDGSESRVNINFNDKLKAASCSCGNKWIPKSHSDWICKTCLPKGADNITLFGAIGLPNDSSNINPAIFIGSEGFNYDKSK